MVKEYPYEEYLIREAPFYLPIKDEIELFKAAYFSKIPVLLKGPTGCGKTRFVEYMTYNLGKQNSHTPIPLITIACHEDLTASDLVGRFLLKGDETVWVDGPLTKAVKTGAICYLDEIVEARKDTTVLIHSLTDHRRVLPSEKRGQIIEANENFLLVISYNPGYQSVLKDLKQSTRQRFVAIDFDYPPQPLECEIIQREGKVTRDIASRLAQLGEKIRNINSYGLEAGVGTRLLIYAGQLMNQGVECKRACQIAVASSLTDDSDIQHAIGEVISTIF